MTIRIGTRKSPLAMAQSGWVAEEIRRKSGGRMRAELCGIVTEGDRIGGADETPLPKWSGGKGVFIKAIDEALLAGAVDMAVHSAKDVPARLADGVAAAAVPMREDPADVLVSREGWTIETAPDGARIGTSSLRRAAQIGFHRPGLSIVSVRGNVETRLGKVGGACDAVVLAAAGIRRLGGDVPGTMGLCAARLDPAVFLPAPGQGILFLVTRAGREPEFDFLNDADSARALALEREVVRALGADCNWPLGAWARPDAAGGGMPKRLALPQV